ncbi:hypothetical protein GCM10010836_46740 [Aminobacter aminovorans]
MLANQPAVPEMAVSLAKPARMKMADRSTRPARVRAEALVLRPDFAVAMEALDMGLGLR